MVEQRWSGAFNCLRWQRLGGPLLAALLTALPSPAQVSYQVRFELEKSQYLVGEPVFCRFVIKNTGSQAFAYRYRTPSRLLSRDYEQEPTFVMTDAQGRRLPDPAPQPCGGTQGTVVYGSVMLPAGQTASERWLVNQWAKFTGPGRIHVRAERRLALSSVDPKTGNFSEKPAAFALALDELEIDLEAPAAGQLAMTYQPYLRQIGDAKERNPAEAVLVVTNLPQPFLWESLVAMTKPTKAERFDRHDALTGLARLGTPAAWESILKLACDPAADDSLRSYAVLLLGEKGDPSALSPLLKLVDGSPEALRGELLRGLGFFSDDRAYQTLFDHLHSASVTDRMNSILGLKNKGSKEVIPAVLAMLNDPSPQVRNVADFALQGMTGHKVALPEDSSDAAPRRLAEDWHGWWQEHGADFSPMLTAPCREW